MYSEASDSPGPLVCLVVETVDELAPHVDVVVNVIGG